MPFRTFCSNKECREEMQPEIDKKTKKVFCTECDKEIDSVDDFMKRQLISMGQVRRVKKESNSFSVKCEKCENMVKPVLGKDRQIICPDSKCGFNMTNSLSAPFVQMLRTTGHITKER